MPLLSSVRAAVEKKAHGYRSKQRSKLLCLQSPADTLLRYGPSGNTRIVQTDTYEREPEILAELLPEQFILRQGNC